MVERLLNHLEVVEIALEEVLEIVHRPFMEEHMDQSSVYSLLSCTDSD